MSPCSSQAASLLSGAQAAPTLAHPQSTARGRAGEKTLGAHGSWSERNTAFHSPGEADEGLSIPAGWTDRMHREPWDAGLCRDLGAAGGAGCPRKGRGQPAQPHVWCVHTPGDWHTPCQSHVSRPGLGPQAATLDGGLQPAQTLRGSDHLPHISLFHGVEFLAVSALADNLPAGKPKRKSRTIFFPCSAWADMKPELCGSGRACGCAHTCVW